MNNTLASTRSQNPSAGICGWNISRPTDTFIDQQIEALRRLGKYEVRTLSLRYPKTIKSFSSEQEAALTKTLYIVPSRWSNFDFTAFIQANLHFMVSRPFVYFQTFLYIINTPPSKYPYQGQDLYSYLNGYICCLSITP